MGISAKVTTSLVNVFKCAGDQDVVIEGTKAEATERGFMLDMSESKQYDTVGYKLCVIERCRDGLDNFHRPYLQLFSKILWL